MTSLQDQKARLRAEMHDRRRALSAGNGAEKDKALKAMAAIFLAHLQLEPGAVVAAYHAFRGELDPAPLAQLLRERGHPIALPLVMGKRMPLAFRLHRPGDALTAHALGFMEPSAAAPAADPDILLVPLLAFDRHRRRLGYGGGYYDRTLAALRARKKILAVGIAYAAQEVEAVPVGPNDSALDKIITEVNIF